MEWDVKDAFYDFPFVGQQRHVRKERIGRTDITYDDTL